MLEVWSGFAYAGVLVWGKGSELFSDPAFYHGDGKGVCRGEDIVFAQATLFRISIEESVRLCDGATSDEGIGGTGYRRSPRNQSK
jgi:hypothetical protein